MRTLSMAVRFCAGLPSFLNHSLDVSQAHASIANGLASREIHLEHILRRFVFGNPTSPYRPLFRAAGVDETTAVGLIHRDGVDGALRRLHHAGVHFTLDEFKHGGEVRRGSELISLDGLEFDRPTIRGGLPVTTSTGHGRARRTVDPASRVALDLDHLAATTPHVLINRDLHGGLDIPWALWRGSLPDPTGFGTLLRAARHRAFADRWFDPVPSSHRPTEVRNRVANRLIRTLAASQGVELPRAEPTPLDRVDVVVDWARNALEEAGRAWIGTSMSLAVRVCLAAQERGIALEGLVFFGGSEPFTEARKRSIESVGARLVPHYFGVDLGQVGLSCVEPSEANDLHLLEDNVALIQPGLERGDAAVTVPDAFCFTALRPTAPKILINVEADDHGILETRSCGCSLERLGYRAHLRRVRSFGKLTCGGATVLRRDLVPILEELLPTRFGGNPQHYQLAEAEGDDGLPRLHLVVDPQVGSIDQDELRRVFFAALGRSGPSADLARGLWEQSDSIQVVRAAPRWTPRAKFENVVSRWRAS